MCPVCQAQFYQRESSMSKVLREAILYANKIIDLSAHDDVDVDTDTADSQSVASTNELDSTFPDIYTKKRSHRKKSSAKAATNVVEQSDAHVFTTPTPLPASCSPATATTTKTTPTAKKRGRKPTASTTTTATTSADIEETQQMMMMMLPSTSRTQSLASTSRRASKKNDKGETPLHLAVIRVKNTIINHLFIRSIYILYFCISLNEG